MSVSGGTFRVGLASSWRTTDLVGRVIGPNARSRMLLAPIIALLLAPQLPQVQATLEGQIGGEDGTLDEVLGRVSDLAADTEGNVYVLDSQFDKVRAFSATGEHLHTFGRRGRDDGDLNRPMRLDVRGGAATVLNPSGQSSNFTLVGEPLAPLRLPFGAQAATRIDETTFVILASAAVSRDDPAPFESLLHLRQGTLDTLLTVPSSDILFSGPSANAAIRTSLCRQAYFVAGVDGEIWLASGADGTLTEWRFIDGVAAPVRSESFAPEGIPLPDSTRTRLLGIVPRQLNQEAGDLMMPPVLSSVCGLELSTDGIAWLRLPDTGSRARWLSVDLETLRATGELLAPEGVAMSAFSGALGYGTWSDEAGVTYVGVYRLE